MQPADPTSTGLNILLISLGVLVIFYNVFIGWRNGVVRQFCRIIALVAAYLFGIILGPILAPLLTFINLPEAAVKLIACLVAGLAIYILLTILTNTLFRKTDEQESAPVRWLYGVGGALIGLVFSAVVLIGFISGIRMLGTVAESQMSVAQARKQELPEKTRVWVPQIARAKKTLENGPAGPAIKAVDPTPPAAYDFLQKLSLVTADQAAMNRFMDFPGTRRLMAHPALQNLAKDAAVQKEIGERNFAALLQNPKIIALYQDESLRPLLQKFELQRALDYSLNPNAPPPPPEVPAVERY